MTDWTNRPAKQASREYALQGYFQERAALFMPGWDEEAQQAGQDVRTGLASGNLDPELPLYVVERNPEWAELIAADLCGLGFKNLILHVGELHTLKPTHKLDFVSIDLFGALDRNICTWMRDTLAPALAPAAIVALTMAYSRRNNRFMFECERIFREDFHTYTSRVRKALDISGHHRLVPVLLMRAIFQNHQFAYRRLMRYHDSIYSMLTFKFTDFSPTRLSNGAPMLDQVLDRMRPLDQVVVRREFEPEDEMEPESEEASAAEPMSYQRRSQAALKAWATRRAQGWVHPSRRAGQQRSDHDQPIRSRPQGVGHPSSPKGAAARTGRFQPAFAGRAQGLGDAPG